MTILAMLTIMAAYFLLLYAGVGLIQDKRFFGSARRKIWMRSPTGSRSVSAARISWGGF